MKISAVLAFALIDLSFSHPWVIRRIVVLMGEGEGAPLLSIVIPPQWLLRRRSSNGRCLWWRHVLWRRLLSGMIVVCWLLRDRIVCRPGMWRLLYSGRGGRRMWSEWLALESGPWCGRGRRWCWATLVKCGRWAFWQWLNCWSGLWWWY